MYISIILLPFLGSILAGFLGRKVGITGSQFICCLSLFLSAILSTIAFFGFSLSFPNLVQLGSWIDSEIMSVAWDFQFDQLSIVFCIMITYITFLILVYTVYYLEGGPHTQRFFSYLSAFAGFMLVLVNGGNYFVMFIGWEGIGIVSYLLIGYYYTRIQATKAAILAFTMNRFGDMILSIGFFALMALFGSIDFSTVFILTPYLNENAITIISLLLFGGACAKSAQFPLHTWLPGSMEAILIIFILIYLNPITCLELDISLFMISFFSTTTIVKRNRDEKGRFTSFSLDKNKIYFTNEVIDILIGSLLGDGFLGYNKKDSIGRKKPNTNARYAITLKNKEYIYIFMKIIISYLY